MSEADILLASLLQASDDEIEGYKQYIDLPEAVTQHAHFSASNRMGWVNLDKYGLFLRDKRDEQKDTSHTRATPAATATAKTSLNPQALKRPSTEVIEISDDNSDAPAALLPPPKKKVKHVKIKAEPIDPLPPTPAPASNPLPVPIVRKYNKDSRIIITTKESVARVVQLDCIPPRWPVEEDTAYVINLSHSKTGATFTGRTKGLDALLKSEDQDSWGRGTNGSTSQPVKLAILDDIPARRSSHDCNGGLHCEFFDEDIFDGYQHRDSDMSLMQELFAQDREQNKNDSSSTIAVTASFHQYVEKMKCKKKDCTGRPVLKLLRKGESDDGKTQFIGCSKWQKNQEFDHLYAALPSAVDEAILSKYMTGQAVESDDVDEYDTDSCAHFIHPRHGKQKACPHTHFRNRELLVGKMVAHRCPVKKIVYTSKDNDIKMLVVIFRGLHSHLPWPLEKPNQEAKEDLARCLDSMGTFGTTGGKLNNSTTTRALLGTDLSTKHASYRDKRRLRDAVLSKRDAATPAGLTWAGIIEQFQQDLGLPLAEQYIHVVQMEGELKLAVCVDPELGELIHEVRYLVPDFTFKRIVGELNEWEVAVWLDSDRERVSIGRVYCNRATKLAFTYIFDGFFMAIEKVTGRPVRFKAFDPEGNILSIHFDMEAAQVQGFAASLLKLIKGRHPETDPDVIVRYVLKLCSVHFMRSTDALVGAVGQETVDYLNRSNIRSFWGFLGPFWWVPPGEYSPASLDIPPPGEYSPAWLDIPPPGRYSPALLGIPPPGEYLPAWLGIPPPGEYLPAWLGITPPGEYLPAWLDIPPPGEYSPAWLDIIPSGEYLPAWLDIPPPGRYSPALLGIIPPGEYSPASLDIPPPGEYLPALLGIPPPGEYSPTWLDIPPSGEYWPALLGIPPPGEYLPAWLGIPPPGEYLPP
ncbi:hypothetical protein C8R43DRAFT_1118579 [Mycena crocata]|nr:hypothetical protein C8R43DRAFT_1118579 [Mycena crocata]